MHTYMSFTTLHVYFDSSLWCKMFILETRLVWQSVSLALPLPALCELLQKIHRLVCRAAKAMYSNFNSRWAANLWL
jgi:hypothetical protein